MGRNKEIKRYVYIKKSGVVENVEMIQKMPFYENEKERAIMVQKVYNQTQKQIFELQKKKKRSKKQDK